MQKTKINTVLVEPAETTEQTEPPYKLPEGWKWETLGNTCNMYQPKTISTKELVDDAKYPVYGANGIIGNYNKYNHETSQLLVTCRGATCGSINISQPFSWINGNAMVIQPNLNNIDLTYLSYVFQSVVDFNTIITGSAQPQITRQSLLPVPIPLPLTIEEQRRIVKRIESLFEKLDAAKEKARNVLDSFETRKAAILHKAFSGELTANWRKQNGVADDSWKTVRFDEIAEIKSNLVDVADFQDFPHIAPDNIEKYTGVLLDYHTIAEDKVTSGKHRFYAGQILYSKIRPYLSKVVIVDFDGLCSADMYPIEAKCDTRFLWYQMLSNEFLEQASNSGSRSVLPKINQKELSIIKMKTCSLPEQHEIVRILDNILQKEQKAKQAAQTVLEQIDLLKKSILARAFRGEL